MATTSSIFKKSPQDYRQPTFEEFYEATRLHAIGTEWDYISDKLGIPIQELMTWPERYPADWDRFVEDTERQFVRQARSEGMAGARRLVYDKDPKIALEAAKALLNYVKTHERVVLEELKERNRLERESKKRKKEIRENVENQPRQDFSDNVGPVSTSADQAEINQTSANTDPAEASTTPPQPRQPNTFPDNTSPEASTEQIICPTVHIATLSESLSPNVTPPGTSRITLTDAGPT
jgi:hypothetical protein